MTRKVFRVLNHLGLRATFVNDHNVTALVVPAPEKMGYLGVKMLVDPLHEQPVQAAYVDTGVTVCSQDTPQ